MAVAAVRLASRLNKSGGPAASVPRVEPRWLLISTIVICVLVPLLMAVWAPMLILADSTAYLGYACQALSDGSLDHFGGCPGIRCFSSRS
jgi:hypothetical protein